MTISTYDQYRQRYVVEYGEPRPNRDIAKIAAYLKLRAERARRAKALRAAPTGPRLDERDGVSFPAASTSGEKNKEATGPTPIQWKETESRPVPVFRPVERKSTPPAQAKPKEVTGTLIGTSGIGAKPANTWAALPCGPTPVEWTPPKGER